MNYVPTNKEIIKTDHIIFSIYSTMIIFTCASVIIFIYIKPPFYSIKMDDYLEFFGLTLLPWMGLPYMLFRSGRIKRLFEKGEEVIATIIRTEPASWPWFFVFYKFSYEDKIYKRIIILMYTKYTKNISEKDELIVMVDPVSKRSYIRDAFENQTGKQ